MSIEDAYIELRKVNKLQQEFITKLSKENKKLKEALEEIREMAKYDCIRECSNDSEYCTVISCLETRIQRKISEVLKDEQISK